MKHEGEKMTRFRFSHDNTLYGDRDKEIQLMVVETYPGGCLYLGRKRTRDGRYAYSGATYRDGQFRNDCWFASGHSYGAFEYVAQWRSRIPDWVR